MKFVYLTTVILFASITDSQGVYENIFCNSCPLTLGSQCQEPQYTCKCVCSAGCTANDGTVVTKGGTLSLANIKNVAEVLQPCSSCLIFWFAWECNDVTTSMNINTCDHYNDYNKYKDDCLTNPSSSPPITIVDESGESVDYSSRRYSPYPPPPHAPDNAPRTPSPPTKINDTSVDIGVGAVLLLAWYYILAICLGGLILIVAVIALFCCCCRAVCCCC